MGVLQTSCSLSPLARLRCSVPVLLVSFLPLHSFRSCSRFAGVVSTTILFSFLFPFCWCRFYHYTVFLPVPVLLVSFLPLYCFRFAGVVSTTTLFSFLFLFCWCRFYHYTVFLPVPVLLVSFLSLYCFRCRNASAVIACVFLFPLYYDTAVYQPCPSSCRHSLCVVSPYNVEYSPVHTRPHITLMSNWALKKQFSLSLSLSCLSVCLSC